jgi:hypothetical protein
MPQAEQGSAAMLNTLRRQLEQAGDPCQDCECCARWQLALELTAASARAHVAGELRLNACSDDCLICALAHQ